MNHSVSALLAGILFVLSMFMPPQFLATREAGPAALEPESSSGFIVVRKNVREVSVNFIVTDSAKRPVRGLKHEEFQVFSDGVEVPTVSAFYADGDLPLQLTILVDTSDSMTAGFVAELRAADRFSQRVARPSIDRVSWMGFAAGVDTLRETAQPALQPVRLSRGAMGQTAVFDAMVEATARMNKSTGKTSPSRRAVILLSDGEDNWSRYTLDDAIEGAQRAGVAIYTITAHNPKWVLPGDVTLHRLARETGGRAFVLGSYDEAPDVFVQIEQELRSQYVVAFPVPAARCGFHSIRVTAIDPTLHVRSRSGYSIDGC